MPFCHKPDIPYSHCYIFGAITWHLSGARGDLVHQSSLIVWIVWIMSDDLKLFNLSLSVSFLPLSLPVIFHLLSVDLNLGESKEGPHSCPCWYWWTKTMHLFFFKSHFLLYMIYVKKMNKQHPCSWNKLLMHSGDKSLRTDL